MGIAAVYTAYLAVSIGLTVTVASALSRSGRVYLTEVFGGDEGMAGAVNRLLVVGFCLLSLGYAALTMRAPGQIHGPGQAIGVLSVKVGQELLVFGLLHLVNIGVVTRFRRRQEAGGRPAPGAGAAAVPGTGLPGAGLPGTSVTGPGASGTGRPGTSGPAWPATPGAGRVPGTRRLGTLAARPAAPKAREALH
jgi:hypothetical protein